MKKKINKVLIGCLISMMITPVFAEKIVKVDTVNGKALYYKQYEMSELTGVGCDPTVYTSLVNEYLQKRGAVHNLEYMARTNQGAMQAPMASGGINGSSTGGSSSSCIDQAANQINNAASRSRTIFSVFSGGSIDFSSLANTIGTQLMNGACQEINRITGQATGQVLNNSGLNSTLGNANGMLGTTVPIANTTISGNTVLNSGNTNLTNGGGVGTQNTGNSSSSSGYMCSWLGVNC